jgi:hypothetical protein
MAGTRGTGRPKGSSRGTTKSGVLHPNFTEPKREKSMLVALTGMCKLAREPGVNELLNKRTEP